MQTVVIRLLLIFAIFSSACSNGQTLKNTPAPEERYMYSDMDVIDEKYVSNLTVSAHLPFKVLEKEVNKRLTGIIYEDNSYDDDGGDNLKAKVWKLGDIKVQGKDNLFLFDIPLKIWVSAGYKIAPLGVPLSGYKDTEFSIRVRLISEVTYSKDWKLITHTKVDSYDWITEPSISVGGFAIPIKSMVSRLLNRNAVKITQAIDKQIQESFDLKTIVTQVWSDAQKPHLLSEDYHTWLITTPQQILATYPSANATTLTIQIGMKGYTQTIVSTPTPIRTVNVKLPPLQIVDKLPQSFQIGLISSISYEEAALVAQNMFKGKKYSFSNNRYNITIKNIELFGQDNKLVIKAGLTGSIKGDVYMKGIPHYDAGTKLITLQELEYDLDTRNVLIKAANWLLHSKFEKMMRESFVIPIGQELDTLTNTLRESLANNEVTPGIFLQGKLDEVLPDKVYLTPEYIYTVVNAKGVVKVDIRELKY